MDTKNRKQVSMTGRVRNLNLSLVFAENKRTNHWGHRFDGCDENSSGLQNPIFHFPLDIRRNPVWERMDCGGFFDV